MKRWFTNPVHICLVGALVLSIGIYSVVYMIGSFLAGEAEFDLGFTLIFVGLGLLRGSSTYRGITGALLALNLVVISIFVVVYLVQGLFFDGDFEGVQLVGMALVFGGVGYFYKVLFDTKNDDWFLKEASEKAPQFVIPLTVILTVFYSSASELKDYRQERAMSEVFRFDLEFKVIDSETGEEISHPRTRYGRIDFGDLSVPDWMKGVRMGSNSFEGYSREPFELKFSAEGYEENTIQVNRYTDSIIEISLIPHSSKTDEMD